jgi:hypothetical protein
MEKMEFSGASKTADKKTQLIDCESDFKVMLPKRSEKDSWGGWTMFV